MSIKIYNGYKLPKMSAADMAELSNSLRKELLPSFQRKIQSLVLISAAEELDYRSLNKEYAAKQTKAPFFHALAKVEERLREMKTSKRRDPAVDLEFEIVFFPTKSSGTLALLYTEQEFFKEAFKKLSKAQEFGYWDNADALDGVSEKDWAAREKLWQEVLGDDTPAKRGLTSTVFDGEWDTMKFIFMVESKDFEPYLKEIPSLKDRVLRAAKDEVYEKKAKQSDAKDSPDFVRILLDQSSFLKTEEGKALLKVKIEAMRNLLVKEITLDVLKKVNS